MNLFSGTARRLFLAFTALVGIFGTASAFALAGLAEVHKSLHEVERHEEGVRAALALGRTVRGAFSGPTRAAVSGRPLQSPSAHAGGPIDAALAHVGRFANRTTERDELREIKAAVDALDRVLSDELVPAARAGDLSLVGAAYGRMEDLFALVDARAERIAGTFDVSIGDSSGHADAVQHASFRFTLLLLLSATAFAAFVGLYIVRSVARPVAELEAGATRIARGELHLRIDDRAPDEFGRLAQKFNAMTEALREHQEKLVQSEKLAGIGRLAAGVAHEINNPLGVILGYVKLLEARVEGPLADDLRIVKEEALRCQAIVEGMLDLARPIRAGRDRIDLRALCDDVVARLRESGQMERVAVDVCGAGTVEGGENVLRQVVLNVVKNAVEAAGDAGRVRVTISQSDEGAATVSVEDSGKGIAPGDRDRLFEPFFTTKPTGTGLGLAVSRVIAEAHGGRIDTGMTPLGGARFTLCLPGSAASAERSTS